MIQYGDYKHTYSFFFKFGYFSTFSVGGMGFVKLSEIIFADGKCTFLLLQ